MASESSFWAEINGENSEHCGRSKRLCTGLGNAREPETTFPIQWSSGAVSQEQSSYDASWHDSGVFDIQRRSASAVDFDPSDHGSRQRVGNVQGQTLFPTDLNPPWPSSDHNLQSPWPGVVNNTPSAYRQVLNIESPLHPASNPQASATCLKRTATSNVLRGSSPHDQHHVSDVGATFQPESQESTSGTIPILQKDRDTGLEDTSCELCLGLVGQDHLWHEVNRPQTIRTAVKQSLALD